jgi:hypothetical protein
MVLAVEALERAEQLARLDPDRRRIDARRGGRSREVPPSNRTRRPTWSRETSISGSPGRSRKVERTSSRGTCTSVSEEATRPATTAGS